MIPDYLRRSLSDAERAAAWERQGPADLAAARAIAARMGPWPAPAVPKGEDPATAALRLELEGDKKRKTRDRLLKAGFIKPEPEPEPVSAISDEW